MITRPIAAALGAVLCGSGAWAVWRGWASRSWPAAPGELVAVDVRWTGAMARGAFPALQYRYTVGGTTREGTRLSFGAHLGRRTERAVRAAVADLVPGGPVTVHYNPRRPDDAVLRPGASPVDFVLIYLGAALLAGGLCG